MGCDVMYMGAAHRACRQLATITAFSTLTKRTPWKSGWLRVAFWSCFWAVLLRGTGALPCRRRVANSHLTLPSSHEWSRKNATLLHSFHFRTFICFAFFTPLFFIFFGFGTFYIWGWRHNEKKRRAKKNVVRNEANTFMHNFYGTLSDRGGVPPTCIWDAKTFWDNTHTHTGLFPHISSFT